MSTLISRRSFLKGSAAGLALAACAAPWGAVIVNASQPGPRLPQGCRINLFVRIMPDESVTIIVPQTELGQGTSTGIPMIVAEELEADWGKVNYEFAPADAEYGLPGLGVQLTGGSRSIRLRYWQLRQAGATARQMLLMAAAEQWRVPLAQCLAQKGVVRHQPSGRSLSYGKLCARAARLPVPEEVKLKEPGQFKLISQPVPRLDIPHKVSGKARFGVDMVMPGMIYAVLARPPAYGARPVSFDQKAAQGVRGVKGVAALKQGIAVCADSFWAAQQGREALNVKWGPGSRPDLDSQGVEQALLAGLRRPGASAGQRGQAEQVLAGAALRVQAEYLLPYLAHAVPEPVNCTAMINDQECQVWAPTQYQTMAKRVAAEISGLGPDKVRVHTTLAGGGFGRRLEADVVSEAVLLAVRFKGSPVQVVWTREDDLQHDVYRPGNASLLQAGLDAQGRLLAWRHKVVLSSIMERFMPGSLGGGVDRSAVEGAVDMPYAVDNFAVEYVNPELPIPVGFWRSVGHSHNFFVVECFMDQVARAAGKDPLEFRLSLLEARPRHQKVLQLAAQKAGWVNPLRPGRGRGLALGACYGSFVAHVAEVSLDQETNSCKVERLVCALDCGQVINPDSVKAQLAGAAIMALSAAFKEKVAFAAGGVESSNFDDYPIMRFDEVPPIEVHLAQSGEDPGGVGEPGIPTVAPAVANAIAAITGRPVRRLPIGNPLA